MKLAAVLQARALAFIEIVDLDPRGKVYFLELVQLIQARYGFIKGPENPEQMDEKKGIEFQIGRFGDIIIDSLKLWDALIAVETHSNTEDSMAVILDALQWAKEKFSLTYERTMIRQWAYVSDVTFYSDASPLLVSDLVQRLSSKVTDEMRQLWKEDLSYVPTVFTVGHDPLKRKNTIAPFTIQRRGEIPFEENKYFSEAPLPTNTHLKILQEFEADLIQSRKQ